MSPSWLKVNDHAESTTLGWSLQRYYNLLDVHTMVTSMFWEEWEERNTVGSVVFHIVLLNFSKGCYKIHIFSKKKDSKFFSSMSPSWLKVNDHAESTTLGWSLQRYYNLLDVHTMVTSMFWEEWEERNTVGSVVFHIVLLNFSKGCYKIHIFSDRY